MHGKKYKIAFNTRCEKLMGQMAYTRDTDITEAPGEQGLKYKLEVQACEDHPLSCVTPQSPEYSPYSIQDRF